MSRPTDTWNVPTVRWESDGQASLFDGQNYYVGGRDQPWLSEAQMSDDAVHEALAAGWTGAGSASAGEW